MVLEARSPSVAVDQDSGRPQREFWGVLRALLSWEFLMMGEFFMF